MELDEFYTSAYRESERLARNRLELLRTQELLRARLPPPPARILDVGGGTGVHAAWLAADGYDVDLVDVVPAHVAAAAEHGTFRARAGDARALPFPDGTFAVTLLLGPLYHLPDDAERAAALCEAVRVTAPGGLVCAAAISRHAFPLYALRDGVALSAERLAALAATLATGRGDPVGTLPSAYSHRPSGLAAELTAAGLAGVEVEGIEGPGWALVTPGDDTRLESALAVARLCDGQPELTAASAHLLGAGLTSAR